MDRGFPSGRRDRDLEPISHPGPIAQNFNFLNLARSVDADVFHFSAVLRERLFPERRLARHHEKRVVGHQPENSCDVAHFGGSHPLVHEVANGLFVVVHMIATFG